MIIVLRVLVLCVGIAASYSAYSQEYPTRTVKLVVPFVAGGGVDTLARIVVPELNNRLGQTAIVEARPGAGGNIGAHYVAKAAPDGYTLLVAGVPQAISMSIYQTSRLNYDFVKDFTPLAGIAHYPSVILLHPSIPANSVKELILLAKSRPGEMTFGSAGIGSPNHLAIEMLKTMAGVQMLHVPYSSGLTLTDLIAGHLHLASLGIPQAISQVQARKLKAIAVTGAVRSPALPHVPTVSESGLEGYDVTSWYGVFAPAATPKAIVNKLAVELAAVSRSPSILKALSKRYATPENRWGEEFGSYVRDEVAKWAKVVKESGVRIE